MIPRRVSGFNLPALLPEQGFNVAKALVGTEGTCVLVLEAKAKLVVQSAGAIAAGFRIPDIFAAADHVVEPAKFGPIGLEALDDTFIDYMKKKGLHPPDMNFMPEGERLAADRVRRQGQGRSRRERAQVHGRFQAGAATPPSDEAVRRSGAGEAGLASPRGRPRRDGEGARTCRKITKAGRMRRFRRTSSGAYLREFKS